MADTAEAITALKESRPPASDRFTYLTIVERFLSPEILPTLNEILQDGPLTQDIGWDLVDMLISIPGSEQCLETIARRGNPREVILKVLEVLEGLEERFGDTDAPELVSGFITLLGMLAILHTRIKTKYPSRFLANTLHTVYRAYLPSQEMTASVINLVRSLSTTKRPPLPSRKSSVNVTNPGQDSDASKNAPDPEAEQEDPIEQELQQKLLLSFVTCVLETFANVNEMAWAPRLLEFYHPEKVVPGKKTALQSFREDEELLARDGVVGQLVALTQDLGLSTCTEAFLKDVCSGTIHRDPLSNLDVSKPDNVALSTGGSVCLIAYWVFSSTVFDANNAKPDMYIFPDHVSLLRKFVSDEDAQAQVMANPGTMEAIITIGLWLEDNKRLSSPQGKTDFMLYHHLLTICSVFHPSLLVRNAATSLAGSILHADPDADDRLAILQDLLENCDFAALKACAITWLREELVLARKSKAAAGRFAEPGCVEQLQYAIFPDQTVLRDMSTDELLGYWAEEAPFVLQAANFAFFLFCSEIFRHVVPEAMGAAVDERYVTPLLAAAERLEPAVSKGGMPKPGMEETVMQLSILQNTLKSLNFHRGT